MRGMLRGERDPPEHLHRAVRDVARRARRRTPSRSTPSGAASAAIERGGCVEHASTTSWRARRACRRACAEAPGSSPIVWPNCRRSAAYARASSSTARPRRRPRRRRAARRSRAAPSALPSTGSAAAASKSSAANGTVGSSEGCSVDDRGVARGTSAERAGDRTTRKWSAATSTRGARAAATEIVSFARARGRSRGEAAPRGGRRVRHGGQVRAERAGDEAQLDGAEVVSARRTRPGAATARLAVAA